MTKNPNVICESEIEKPYAPSPLGSHVLTLEQVIEFERLQAEPPQQPTEAEREAVRIFRATVRR